jgi:hypothetical protein
MNTGFGGPCSSSPAINALSVGTHVIKAVCGTTSATVTQVVKPKP